MEGFGNDDCHPIPSTSESEALQMKSDSVAGAFCEVDVTQQDFGQAINQYV